MKKTHLTNRYLLLISLLVFILFMILFAVFISNFNLLGPSEEYPSLADPGTVNDQNDIEVKKSYTTGLLINKLPYSGDNFYLAYDFDDASFALYINPSAVSEGNQEFENFLRQNNIDDKDWLGNIKITDQPFTPEPE